MTLAFVFVLMTAAAILAVLWPLRRQRGSVRSGSDVEVYRDQLDEIERDRAAGRIGKAEAEAARVEVSRRLLGATDAAAAPSIADAGLPPSRRRAGVVIAAVVLLPICAGGFYALLGSPGIPTLPVAERLDDEAEHARMAKMVTQVEAYLEHNPDNARGWETLAPIYMQTGRYSDAVKARRRALEILGPDPARLGDLGEAMTLAAGGIVTPEAKELFARAAVLDRDDVMAQFYLALAAKQDGRRDEAEKAWRALLAQAPQGAPWIPLVQGALARIDEKTVPATEAAATEHGGSVEDMVERLAERLRKDGSNPDGWIQLVRSYRVLGQADKAAAAITAANFALAGDPDKLRRFTESVKALDAELAKNPAPARTAGDKPRPPAPAAAGTPNPPRTGPSEKDIAAASTEVPEQQKQMVQGMVDRLAERLKTESSDLDGWLRLLRSYKVLGDMEKARDATETARRAFAGEPEKLRQLNEAIKGLGL